MSTIRIIDKKLYFYLLIKAGIKVGDLLMAVNKDVTLESNYDEVRDHKLCNKLCQRFMHSKKKMLLKTANKFAKTKEFVC